MKRILSAILFVVLCAPLSGSTTMVDWSSQVKNKPARQLNFGWEDPATAQTLRTIDGIWAPENSTVTLVSVRCLADTSDAVVQVRIGGASALSSNLTCGSSAWSTAATAFSTSTLTTSGYLGVQFISGTAKKIMFSIKYTGNN
jgi:hypothetical protein